ncbi:MAG: DUF4115 domain-containing protein [Nevskia sp.]|nr:DUF4115 domain-containing protein [Nevskia sp.]
MNNDTTASEAAATPETSLDSQRQGPGRLIRLARERARLGISELAGLTKLAPSTLEALERDDFAVLNEPVYVRGYYRKCAKALAISEQELLAAYERMVAPKAPQAPTKLLLGGSGTGSSLRKTRRGSGSRWLAWVIGLLAFIAAAAWLLRVDPNAHRVATGETSAAPAASAAPALAKPVAPAPAEPQASPPPASAPAATVEPAARPQSTNELATSPSERGLSQTPASEPPPASAPVSTPPQPTLASELATPAPPPPRPAAASAAAPATGGNALVLNFKSTSWVRVEDASGKVLLSGVIQSGDRQTVAGKPPYSLFLGNAPGVSVEYQGRPVDLRAYIKSNDTARLSVPGDGG